MIKETIYPDQPLAIQEWYNYISLQVAKAKGINKTVRRPKASHSKNKFKK